MQIGYKPNSASRLSMRFKQDLLIAFSSVRKQIKRIFFFK